MVCRCATKEQHAQRAVDSARESHKYEVGKLKKELDALRADIRSFAIEDVLALGKFLLLAVRYTHPDGKALENCTFEGIKVMVFEATTVEALKWQAIDPHFRSDEKKNQGIKHEAPSPIARFPGNNKGWSDGVKFVKIIGGII